MFLVDLDLSTLHGTGKSSASRRTLGKSIQTRKSTSKHDSNALGQDRSESDELAATSVTQSKDTQQNGITTGKLSRGVQIIDIDTTEPIISYNDEIYACSWTDTVGTNLFFGPVDDVSHTEAPLTAKYGALLGASRLKLLGNRVTLSKAENKKRARIEGEDNQRTVDSQGEPESGASNLEGNNEIRQQIDFLRRLTDVKRRRQETDLVAGVAGSRALSSGAQADIPVPVVTQTKEVDELNLPRGKDDIDALSRLRTLDPRLGQPLDQTISAPTLPIASNQVEVPNAEVSNDSQVLMDQANNI